MKIYDYEGKKNICGKRVHDARCKMRLTQSELAARLQVNGIIIERDSISRIEIGTRFVADYEIRELAKILNVSANWLLGLPERGGGGATVHGDGNAVAVGTGARATTKVPTDCSKCKLMQAHLREITGR